MYIFDQFGDDSDSDSSTGLSSLPYPKPLKRSDFLTPDFNPTTYLSQLQENRHQTLEDLRSELRTRSQELNKELLDLVNENYQDFLSLGSSLKGGDEKVEEVRLALLGFQREIAGLVEKVDERKAEVESLMTERKEVREHIQFGRGLLELDRRVVELEQKLMLVPTAAGDRDGAGERNGQRAEEEADDDSDDGSADEDEADEGEEEVITLPVKRFRRLAQRYVSVSRLAKRLGSEHPFVSKQEARRAKLKEALLLDMGSAMKRIVETDGEEKSGQLYMMETYEMMEAAEECLKAVKEAAKREEVRNGN